MLVEKQFLCCRGNISHQVLSQWQHQILPGVSTAGKKNRSTQSTSHTFSSGLIIFFKLSHFVQHVKLPNIYIKKSGSKTSHLASAKMLWMGFVHVVYSSSEFSRENTWVCIFWALPMSWTLGCWLLLGEFFFILIRNLWRHAFAC